MSKKIFEPRSCEICGQVFQPRYFNSKTCEKEDCREAFYRLRYSNQNAKVKQRRDKDSVKYTKPGKSRPFSTVTIAVFALMKHQGWTIEFVANMLDRDLDECKQFLAEITANGRLQEAIDGRAERVKEESKLFGGNKPNMPCRSAKLWGRNISEGRKKHSKG